MSATQPIAAPSYLDESHSLRSWLTTRDHKRIAILYAISITFFFFVGGAAATLMRLELITPQGDLVTAETYNKLFTIRGSPALMKLAAVAGFLWLATLAALSLSDFLMRLPDS